MKCADFMKDPMAAVDTSEGRKHLRVCDECYRAAVRIDPVAMLSAMDPAEPTNHETENLVRDVMSAVNARSHEKAIEAREEPPRWVGLAAAAAVIMAILSGLFVQERLTDPSNMIQQPTAIEASNERSSAVAIPVSTRPVVESYSSSTATIVELPYENDDMQLVMIFDETLPQDL